MEALAGGDRSDTELCDPRRHWEAWTAQESQPRLNWGNVAVRGVAAPSIPCQCSHPGQQHSHNMLMRSRGTRDVGGLLPPGTVAQSLLPGTYRIRAAPVTLVVWDSRVPWGAVQAQRQNCQSDGWIKVNWQQDVQIKKLFLFRLPNKRSVITDCLLSHPEECTESLGASAPKLEHTAFFLPHSWIYLSTGLSPLSRLSNCWSVSDSIWIIFAQTPCTQGINKRC